MSTIANYTRITPEELAELQANPETTRDFLFPEGEDADLDDETYFDDERNLDIDKAWHGIHFLLTGSVWEGDPPLMNAVLGGIELGDEDVGYGPARFLTQGEVLETAEALSQISEADLRSRYDASAMAKADIYPSIWKEDAGSLDYLMEYYVELVRFFKEASANGEAMLLYLT